MPAVPAAPPSPGPAPAGSGPAGERQVFRAAGPQIIWWVWLAFAAANLIDLALQGRDHFAAEVAAFILLATGIAYACAWRPRIVADDSALTLLNPLRDYVVPWTAVQRVALGGSLTVHCAREPGAAKQKSLYSWAIQSSKRGRSNAGRRARRTDRDMATRSAAYARLPAEAREAKGKTPAELIAQQLNGRAAGIRGRDLPTGRPAGRWAWWPIAAMVAPAILFALVIAF
jgi:hypothetical protein